MSNKHINNVANSRDNVLGSSSDGPLSDLSRTPRDALTGTAPPLDYVMVSNNNNNNNSIALRRMSNKPPLSQSLASLKLSLKLSSNSNNRGSHVGQPETKEESKNGDDERKQNSTNGSSTQSSLHGRRQRRRSTNRQPAILMPLYNQQNFRLGNNVIIPEENAGWDTISNIFQMGDFIQKGSYAMVYTGWLKDRVDRVANPPELFCGATVVAKSVGSRTYYRGKIVKVHSNNTYDVKYDDNSFAKDVQKAQIEKAFAIRREWIGNEERLRKKLAELRVVDELMRLNLSAGIEYFAYYFNKEDQSQQLYSYEIMDMGECSLHEMLESMKSHGKFTEKELLKFARQMMETLVILHENGILHRDIKPANIVVNEVQPRDNIYSLCDFGSARTTDNDNTLTNSFMPNGTPYYLAPELLQHHERSAKSDTWSVGIIIYEMVLGKNPFDGMRTRAAMFHALQILDEDLEIPENCIASKSFIALLKRLLKFNPEERLSASDFLNQLENCKTLLEERQADEEKMERLRMLVVNQDNDSKRQRNVICSNVIAAKKKDLKIVQSKDEIICQDREIKNLQQLLTNASNTIAEKDDEINGYVAVVAEKDAEIDAHRIVIAEKDHELVRQRDLLTVKDDEITGYVAAVAEKDAQLDAHRVAIAEKDHELVRQRDLLTVKGDEITGYVAAVAEKDAQLDAHRVAIAEKDNELVRQRDLLTVKGGEITGYVAAVAEKDAQLDAHRVAIAEKDSEIENLQQQLANANDSIGGKDQEIANCRQLLANANGIIESLRIQTKTYANGHVYVGQMKDGKQHCFGTYTWPDGEVYVGEFQDGKRTGKGTYTYAGGSVYVGDWKDGKKHGYGKWTNADGSIWHKGMFKDGFRVR